jgi:hypothetical protein
MVPGGFGFVFSSSMAGIPAPNMSSPALIVVPIPPKLLVKKDMADMSSSLKLLFSATGIASGMLFLPLEA